MASEDSGSNRATLNSYEAKLEEYIAGSPQEVEGELKKFIDGAFADVESGATVLELGAGFGRDALYLREKGFAVIPTDAARSFVEELQRRGLPAYELNMLTDSFPKTDVIFANAVFLHLSVEELREVLLKARAALNPGGKLIFTVKLGAGEEWSTAKLDAPRFFVYWDFEPIVSELIRAGFTAVDAVKDDTDPTSWLQAVAS